MTVNEQYRNFHNTLEAAMLAVFGEYYVKSNIVKNGDRFISISLHLSIDKEILNIYWDQEKSVWFVNSRPIRFASTTISIKISQAARMKNASLTLERFIESNDSVTVIRNIIDHIVEKKFSMFMKKRKKKA